jgi:hypothetical protein
MYTAWLEASEHAAPKRPGTSRMLLVAQAGMVEDHGPSINAIATSGRPSPRSISGRILTRSKGPDNPSLLEINC